MQTVWNPALSDQRFLGCFWLGNPEFDLKIRIFGFPIEYEIRKGISRQILLIEILIHDMAFN